MTFMGDIVGVPAAHLAQHGGPPISRRPSVPCGFSRKVDFQDRAVMSQNPILSIHFLSKGTGKPSPYPSATVFSSWPKIAQR